MLSDERILELWRTRRVPDVEWFEVADFARAVEAETLEAAAKVCVELPPDDDDPRRMAIRFARSAACAAAIRALKEKEGRHVD